VHVAPALGAGAGQDEAAHRPGAAQDDLLGDEATQGEAEQVVAGHLEGVEEGDGVAGHLFDGAGSGAGGAGDAGVVDEDELALGGDGVDEQGVPVVQAGAVVHQADQRHAALAGGAEAR
jgi:hypothetical protein